jgi:hypothetical protein
MEQIRYQGYARDRGFNPIQVSTASVEAIGQQGSAMLRQMRENQDIERSNRNAFIQAQQNAQQLERQNRADNFQFQQQSRQQYQQGVLRNQEIKIQDAVNAQRNFDKDMTALAVLGNFSSTIAKQVVEWKKSKDEAERTQAYVDTYINGPDPVKAGQVQQGVDAIYQADDRIKETALNLQAAGASPEAVRSVTKLSAAGKIGRAQALWEMAAMDWPSWLQQQRSENETPLLQMVDQSTGLPVAVSPKTAVGPEQLQAVNRILLKQYLKERGLVGIGRPELAAPMLQKMRAAEMQMLEDERMAYSISSSEQQLDDAKAAVVPQLRSDPGKAFTRLVTAYSMSLDQRGRPLGRSTGRQKALDFLRQGIDAGDIDAAAIDNIENSPTPHQPSKTWGELYPYEFAKLREEIDSNYIEDSNRRDAIQKQEGKQWYDSVIEDLSQNPPSQETVAQLTRFGLNNFGYIDDRLQYYANNLTQEKLDADSLNAEFTKLAQSNRLTLSMVQDPRVPWDVRQRWEGTAKAQTSAREQTGDFKDEKEAIELKVLAAAQWNSASGAPKHYTIPLAIAAANAKFNNSVAVLMKSGMSPQQAAQQAAQDIITEIGDGTTGRFKFRTEDDTGFRSFGFTGYGTSKEAIADATRHFNFVKAKIAGGGAASLDRFALIPKEILRQAVEQGASPNYKPPAIANYISELYNGSISPFEVLSRQAAAQKVGTVPIPLPMQEVNQVISPKLRQLLLYKPSTNRTYRAYTGSGVFNENLVPNGYGRLIAQVASANGVDPGLLAGLVRVESNFNPNAVSRAGAVGLGQLMPGTAGELGVNPRDPQQNLQGAARYLRKMIDSFGGDLTAGLRAYNQGPGNQQRFPDGVSEEARSYPRKVLQAAAAFGFNPNGGSPWRNGATMRPKLVYRIDGIGPTSTGPHLDVKDTTGGLFGRYDLDKYIEVEVKGKRLPLSTVMTDDQAAHRRRGSHGIDFAYDRGTPVFLKNGARVVSNTPTEHGDKLVIQLPNGRTFSFLHGRKA